MRPTYLVVVHKTKMAGLLRLRNKDLGVLPKCICHRSGRTFLATENEKVGWEGCLAIDHP